MLFKKLKFRTPILLIGFNRPDLFKVVLKTILKQNPEKLYIAIDGPRNEEDRKKQAEILKLIDKTRKKYPLKTLIREQNLGCGLGVSSAITWFFENEEMGIILEDDTVPHPSFFHYCEIMLNKFKDEPRVGHISGNCFLPKEKLPNSSYFFSCYNHIWGWATWQRVWKDYNFNIDLINKAHLKNSLEELEYGVTFTDYWLNIYNKMAKHEVDTWDYQYTLLCLAKKYLTVIPSGNLVDNIGFREDATHTKSKKPLFLKKPVAFPLKKIIECKNIDFNKENDRYVTRLMFEG